MTAVLLDTHAWVWSFADDSLLSPAARQAITAADAVHVSPISFFEIGQKVRLTADGDDTVFAGEITGIDPKVDPSSRLVAVRAAIDNPDGRLTPGQFVRINVELPQEDAVIALPQTALVTSLYGDYVYAARPRQGLT